MLSDRAGSVNETWTGRRRRCGGCDRGARVRWVRRVRCGVRRTPDVEPGQPAESARRLTQSSAPSSVRARRRRSPRAACLVHPAASRDERRRPVFRRRAARRPRGARSGRVRGDRPPSSPSRRHGTSPPAPLTTSSGCTRRRPMTSWCTSSGTQAATTSCGLTCFSTRGWSCCTMRTCTTRAPRACCPGDAPRSTPAELVFNHPDAAAGAGGHRRGGIRRADLLLLADAPQRRAVGPPSSGAQPDAWRPNSANRSTALLSM